MMKNPNPDLLLYIAMADACAAGAEYLKFPRDDAVRDACLGFERYVSHPTHQGHPGLYTDDTEMSAANARVLIEQEPPYTTKMFADAYVREFLRGGRRKGYSRKFQTLLESISSGDEFMERVVPSSDKNGAAMRAMPIGALPTAQLVLDVADFQARLTHDTPEGRFSAKAVALMSHFALYEDHPLEDVADYCMDHLPADELKHFGHVFAEPWSGEPVTTTERTPVSITTVHAVVDVVMSETSLMDMLARIIRWGGDTDSVAAIAWGIASARFRGEKLPEFLERDLEGGNTSTGADYLRQTGAALMARFA